MPLGRAVYVDTSGAVTCGSLANFLTSEPALLYAVSTCGCGHGSLRLYTIPLLSTAGTSPSLTLRPDSSIALSTAPSVIAVCPALSALAIIPPASPLWYSLSLHPTSEPISSSSSCTLSTTPAPVIVGAVVRGRVLFFVRRWSSLSHPTSSPAPLSACLERLGGLATLCPASSITWAPPPPSLSLDLEDRRRPPLEVEHTRPLDPHSAADGLGCGWTDNGGAVVVVGTVSGELEGHLVVAGGRGLRSLPLWRVACGAGCVVANVAVTFRGGSACVVTPPQSGVRRAPLGDAQVPVGLGRVAGDGGAGCVPLPATPPYSAARPFPFGEEVSIGEIFGDGGEDGVSRNGGGETVGSRYGFVSVLVAMMFGSGRWCILVGDAVLHGCPTVVYCGGARRLRVEAKGGLWNTRGACALAPAGGAVESAVWRGDGSASGPGVRRGVNVMVVGAAGERVGGAVGAFSGETRLGDCRVEGGVGVEDGGGEFDCGANGSGSDIVVLFGSHCGIVAGSTVRSLCEGRGGDAEGLNLKDFIVVPSQQVSLPPFGNNENSTMGDVSPNVGVRSAPVATVARARHRKRLVANEARLSRAVALVGDAGGGVDGGLAVSCVAVGEGWRWEAASIAPARRASVVRSRHGGVVVSGTAGGSIYVAPVGVGVRTRCCTSSCRVRVHIRSGASAVVSVAVPLDWSEGNKPQGGLVWTEATRCSDGAMGSSTHSAVASTTPSSGALGVHAAAPGDVPSPYGGGCAIVDVSVVEPMIMAFPRDQAAVAEWLSSSRLPSEARVGGSACPSVKCDDGCLHAVLFSSVIGVAGICM